MNLFTKKCVIGMVHCLPLPGTLGYCGSMQKVIDQAVADAVTLQRAGVHAIIVENMGDSPFAATMDTEQRIALAVAAAHVKQAVTLPVGIDAAFNDYEAGISIAHAIGAQFVRLPVFVDTVMTANGLIQPCARDAVRFRKALGALDVQIFADVQVKHSHMLVQEIGVVESAHMAADSGADAIIVTGAQIGMETPLDVIRAVKQSVKLPIIAGSGFHAGNAKQQFEVADGAIVGSSLKKGGIISNPVSYELTRALMDAVQ